MKGDLMITIWVNNITKTNNFKMCNSKLCPSVVDD